jgi:hypothetical protein
MKNRYENWNLECLTPQADLLMTAVKETSKCKLDFVVVQKVGWDRSWTEQAGKLHFCMKREMRTMN